MAYTREQLNQAIQAKDAQRKKYSRIYIIISAVLLVVKICASSGIGVLAGFVLSYVNLSPLIAGGIIGLSAPLVCFVMDACCGFYEFSSVKENISEEHKRILKEYNNSAERRIKTCVNYIVDIIASFGIGMGLVALGLTSPAAIGAVTTIPALVVLCFLDSLIERAVEHFFPEGRK